MSEFHCPASGALCLPVAPPFFRQLILLFVWLFGLINAHAAFAQSTWVSIGPEGGPVNALAIDPTTPATLYAGAGGGVFLLF